MRAFHVLKISIPLPGPSEPEEGWHPAFTHDLAATGAYHEITREGLLVRLPAVDRDEGLSEEPPAVVPHTGDLRFDLGGPGGAQGTFVARLEEGRVLWAERLDYERFGGKARLYYADGRPVTMDDEEYRERRRADHEEALIEDHVVSTLSPRAVSDGGGLRVETRGGARFEVVPEGELALPKPGDEVRLYLVPGGNVGAPGQIVGVDLNGESVYYEAPEEHARRSAPPSGEDLDELERRAMRQWLQLGSPGGLSLRGFVASAAIESSIDFPNLAGSERRAQRMQETHEEAHRQSHQAIASRLLGHALDLSHDDAATMNPTTPDPLLDTASWERWCEGRFLDEGEGEAE